MLSNSKNITEIKKQLIKQYNFTTTQLTKILDKYKNNTDKLKTEIKKIEELYKEGCDYTAMSISALLFDALEWAK